MLLPILSTSFALLIAGIFLAAGISKWQAENQLFYQQTIDAYAITPVRWTACLLKLLAIAEIGIALLSVVPLTQKFGLLLAAIMLSVYLYSFAKQLKQGKVDMVCGCAGSSKRLKISSGLLIRNALLIGMCILAIFTPVNSVTLSWFIVLPTAVLSGLFYLSCEQLISNNQKIQALRLSGL
jgi:uncharacterized membrane protein YphA (DoxX/SURF4 family)